MQQSSEMQKLICDIQNGVPLSFETVYSLYGPLINSLAEKYGVMSVPTLVFFGDGELEDLRQEAAIALYDAALAFNPERGVSFGLYAKICIKNRIISYLRSINGKSVKAEPIDLTPQNEVSASLDIDPEKLIISKESLADLERRISLSLTDLERSVFDLYLASATYEDIAAELGKPKKSIDNAMQRIKAKLRKLL